MDNIGDLHAENNTLRDKVGDFQKVYVAVKSIEEQIAASPWQECSNEPQSSVQALHTLAHDTKLSEGVPHLQLFLSNLHGSLVLHLEESSLWHGERNDLLASVDHLEEALLLRQTELNHLSSTLSEQCQNGAHVSDNLKYLFLIILKIYL